MLPAELLHEPYSFKPATSQSPIYRSRRRFLYTIHPEFSVRVTGHRAMRSYHYLVPDDHRYEQLTKRSSCVSVRAVYEIYGLNIVLRYLRHVDWITSYLLGCVHNLRPDLEYYTNYVTPQALIADLELTLRRLDAKRPRMLGDLQPVIHELPIELIARITLVTSNLIGVPYPTLPELIERVVGQPVQAYHHSCYLVELADKQAGLEPKNAGFTLRESGILHTGDIVEFSLGTYERWYGTKTAVVQYLRQIDIRDMREVCAWTAQLGHQKPWYRYRHFSRAQLVAELQRLIELYAATR